MRVGGNDPKRGHLPAANLFATHIVLHDRVAAREAVLVPEPIEDPLGGVPPLALNPPDAEVAAILLSRKSS
jgi:hypothetical protein